jgi:hypothetical protein
MTFDEINVILETNDFEINPSHCSHPLPDIQRLKREKDIGKLLKIFNTVDWTQRSDLIKTKVREDDRFLDMLLDKTESFALRDKHLITDRNDTTVESLRGDNQYLEINKNRRESSKKFFESLLNLLAVEERKTPELYLEDWLREQMTGLVDILLGKIRVEGTQRDLQVSH